MFGAPFRAPFSRGLGIIPTEKTLTASVSVQTSTKREFVYEKILLALVEAKGFIETNFLKIVAFAANISASSTIRRQIEKIISRTVIVKSVAVKTTQKTIVSVILAASTITRNKVFLKAITSTVLMTASMVRQTVVEKILSASISVSASWGKYALKNITRAVSTTISTKKDITKTMTLKVTIIPKLLKTAKKPLTAFVSVISSLVGRMFGPPQFIMRELPAEFVMVETPPEFVLRELDV
jgi:hypothetical protein